MSVRGDPTSGPVLHGRNDPGGETRPLPKLPLDAERQFFLKCYLAAQAGHPAAIARTGKAAEQWQELLRHTIGARFEPGHRIAVLRNGKEIFPAMLEAIESAKHNIEFLFFVFWKGEVVERFCHALIERANAGVRVSVVLDGFGSAPLQKKLRRCLEDSAVHLRTFHPVPHWKFWGLGARTHRKILVIDGVRAFTGGIGIAEEWTGNAHDAEHFRETQFDIRGPAVGALRAAFFSNWAAAGGTFPDDLHLPQPRPRRGVPAAVVASQGAEEWSKISLLFQGLIRLADRELHIVTPYFVPGRPVAEALAAAARKGVRVQIMVSGKNTDHEVARFAGQRYFDELLSAGVEILEYDRTLLHTKAVIVDRRLCCIGSPNMNQRSQSQDDEIAVLIDDDSVADELLSDFADDRAWCRAIDLETWRDRGMIQRLREWWAGGMEAQL